MKKIINILLLICLSVVNAQKVQSFKEILMLSEGGDVPSNFMLEYKGWTDKGTFYPKGVKPGTELQSMQWYVYDKIGSRQELVMTVIGERNPDYRTTYLVTDLLFNDDALLNKITAGLFNLKLGRSKEGCKIEDSCYIDSANNREIILSKSTFMLGESEIPCYMITIKEKIVWQ